MTAQKPLQISGGRVTEIQASDSSAGAGDAGKIVALNSAGQVDQSMMPTGIGPDTSSIVASEALAAGDYVNIFNDAGTPKVRKADATTVGKEADGFVLSAVSAAAIALVYHEGGNTAVTGLTVGSRYYLSTTAGAGVVTAPSATGNVVQFLGRAVSATKLVFEADEGIIRA